MSWMVENIADQSDEPVLAQPFFLDRTVKPMYPDFGSIL